jgi:gas vesicle protein
MSEVSKEEIRERMGNVELIRDIIFGSKLQEYDNRLDKLESHLSLLDKEMRDRTLAVKTECLTELRASVDSLEEKIKSLSLTSQRDNADIRQLIDRTYKSFSSSLESIDKTVVSQSSSIRKELSETREKLQEDTQSLKAQIFDELEKRFSMLKDVKLSRNDMADILFELGLRIKKAEFTPELKDSTNSNGSDGVFLIEASQVTE